MLRRAIRGFECGGRFKRWSREVLDQMRQAVGDA